MATKPFDRTFCSTPNGVDGLSIGFLDPFEISIKEYQEQQENNAYADNCQDIIIQLISLPSVNNYIKGIKICWHQSKFDGYIILTSMLPV